MQLASTFSSLSEAGGRGAVVALGTFDGIHLGHRAVIEYILARAREQKKPAAVITFTAHPLATIAPHFAPPQLVSRQERQRILASWGLDFLVELSFTPALALVGAFDFVKALVDEAGPTEIAVGENYSFGKDGEGDAAHLAEYAAKLGVSCVHIISLLKIDKNTVSSTRIRELIREGDIARANALLGRSYSLAGRVETGEKVGRTLGFPTANIAVPPGFSLPPNGAYLALAIVGGKSHPALVAVTGKPTFGGCARRIEAHLLNFSGDIYGETMRLEFQSFLRREQKFSSLAALKEQLCRDKKMAKERFGL